MRLRVIFVPQSRNYFKFFFAGDRINPTSLTAIIWNKIQMSTDRDNLIVYLTTLEIRNRSAGEKKRDGESRFRD